MSSRSERCLAKAEQRRQVADAADTSGAKRCTKNWHANGCIFRYAAWLLRNRFPSAKPADVTFCGTVLRGRFSLRGP
jgi:hypothetical protein